MIETCLSSPHISPQPLRPHRQGDEVEGYGYFITASNCEPSTEDLYAEVAVNGRYVSVKKYGTKMLDYDKGRSYGKRGVVNVEMSYGSRRRLLRTMGKIDVTKTPLFVTITYPGQITSGRKEWKKDLDRLGKRMLRKFPEAAFLWRMEIMERKSGEAKGRVAPHYHMLVWGVSRYEMRNWLPEAWNTIVAEGDVDHLKVHQHRDIVQKIDTWRGTMSYVGKYIAKQSETMIGSFGRVWGMIGRANMPWADIVRFSITQDMANRAVRMGRKLLGIDRVDLIYGLTWLMDGYKFVQYITMIGEGQEWSIMTINGQSSA